jgi:hypothetical protein
MGAFVSTMVMGKRNAFVEERKHGKGLRIKSRCRIT